MQLRGHPSSKDQEADNSPYLLFGCDVLIHFLSNFVYHAFTRGRPYQLHPSAGGSEQWSERAFSLAYSFWCILNQNRMSDSYVEEVLL